jgi:rhamnose utilization protein RhaD (predicted bifunctional aldolase and dehydrogenase)
MNKDLKKKIAAGGLAAIVGATSGIAIEKAINSKNNYEKNIKPVKQAEEIMNEEDNNTVIVHEQTETSNRQKAIELTSLEDIEKAEQELNNQFDEDAEKAGFVEVEEGHYADPEVAKEKYNKSR